MVTSTDPKRQITVAASNQLRRMATKPRYVTDLEQRVAKGPGPFDAAGGAFPLDIPSEAFEHHLRELEAALDRAEVQFAALRGLAVSIRAIAEGRSASADEAGTAVPAVGPHAVSSWPDVEPERHDPGIHEPPPPPETSEAKPEAQPSTVAAPVAAPAMTWQCPEHGQYTEAISRKNRPYRYCPVADCGRLDIMLT